MNTIVTALKEMYGLFVEDGSLAVSVVVWVVVAALVLPRLPGGSEWRGPVLFAGTAALLLVNVWRAAVQHRERAEGAGASSHK